MQAKHLFVRLGAVMLLIVLLTISNIPVAARASADDPVPLGEGSSTALAAQSCQCVTYIKNRYGLTGSIGGSGCAKDMGPYLAARGFRKVSNPQVGAVVIFQPSFGSGINQSCGHVAVIVKVQSVDNNSKWSITVRGANQGGSTFTQYNCTNVSDVSFKSYPKTSTSVSYYVR